MYFANPSISLTPFVKQYWGIQNKKCIPKEYSIKIIPHGLIEFDFYLGKLPQINEPGRSISERSMMNGLQQSYYDIQIYDELDLFSVIFKPAGAAMLLDIPLHVVNNQSVPLQNFLNFPVKELEEKLYKASTFYDRVDVMEKYLIKLLKKREESVDYNRIQSVISIINSSGGIAELDSLAADACLSRKQFDRIFQKYVGSSPKQYLRVIRFQYSIYCKANNKDVSLTELAYKCGYYDQSHMISDYKTLTGLTPKQYFTGCDPMSDYFM